LSALIFILFIQLDTTEWPNNNYLLHTQGKRECHPINKVYIRYYINATPINVPSALALLSTDAQSYTSMLLFSFLGMTRDFCQPDSQSALYKIHLIK
jgi:hypothetical protein